jgi:hypothetical protein
MGYSSDSTYPMALTIGRDSCIGDYTCYGFMRNANDANITGGVVTIGSKSCIGDNSCYFYDHDGLDKFIVGDESCNGVAACYSKATTNTTALQIEIGAGSCNCDGCCNECPDGTIIGANMCNSPGDVGCCSVTTSLPGRFPTPESFEEEAKRVARKQAKEAKRLAEQEEKKLEDAAKQLVRDAKLKRLGRLGGEQ